MKSFRQEQFETGIKIFILNKYYKKWLAKNKDKIVKEIKKGFLKEQGVDIDDINIEEMLTRSKITCQYTQKN